MESCGLGIPGVWTTLQHRLRDIGRQADDFGMKLNELKTKLIVLNPKGRKAVPFVCLNDGDPLQCVEQIRLLGLILDHDLSWWGLVTDIEERVRKKVWSLAKLREVGATIEDMKDLYIARIRSTIEDSAQIYGCVLTGVQSARIESVQVRCLQIILGVKSRSYSKNLDLLNLE